MTFTFKDHGQEIAVEVTEVGDIVVTSNLPVGYRKRLEGMLRRFVERSACYFASPENQGDYLVEFLDGKTLTHSAPVMEKHEPDSVY